MENVILTFQEQKDSRKQIHEMKGIIEEVKMGYHLISWNWEKKPKYHIESITGTLI